MSSVVRRRSVWSSVGASIFRLIPQHNLSPSRPSRHNIALLSSLMYHFYITHYNTSTNSCTYLSPPPSWWAVFNINISFKITADCRRCRYKRVGTNCKLTLVRNNLVNFLSAEKTSRLVLLIWSEPWEKYCIAVESIDMNINILSLWVKSNRYMCSLPYMYIVVIADVIYLCVQNVMTTVDSSVLTSRQKERKNDVTGDLMKFACTLTVTQMKWHVVVTATFLLIMNILLTIIVSYWYK